MTERLPSGEPGLDGVLGGGLPGNSISLIIGPPGSGKTILAEQYAFHNATPARPALYLATVSEPLEKLVRYGQSLSFFDPQAIGSSVFFEDLGESLHERGLPAVLETVSTLIRTHRPGIIVIDSFKALEAFGAADEFRRFLHDLAGQLTAFRTSSLWVGEYGEDALASAPAFAVADAILSLTAERDGSRQMRMLRVLKLRGSGFASGEHAYRLGGDGIQVFPRLADVGVTDYAPELRRTTSGVPDLDVMLEGGYWVGSSTLVAGPSGSGKTLMAAHFASGAADAGEPAVFATLEENPVQLARSVAPFGWSLGDPGVELLYRSPVDLYLEEWLAEVLGLVKSTGARRLVVDSIGDLRLGTTDPVRFREYLYSLLQHCAVSGVSLMMTLEVVGGGAPFMAVEHGVSNLADNVVLLDFLRDGAEMKRTVAIAKTRGSGHDSHIRELQVSTEGLLLGDPIGALRV
jgi:circadian clock protein KaiC